MRYVVGIWSLALMLATAVVPSATAQNLTTRTVLTGLDTPWELLWGPDNQIWFTERSGRISRVDPTTGERQTVAVIPDVDEDNEAGLMGMALHPNFADTPYVFVVYSYTESWLRIKLVRYTYDGTGLTSPLTLLSDVYASGLHAGSRLLITPDRKILMTMGDGREQNMAQSHGTKNGKILRLELDGKTPKDNPWATAPAPADLLWSTGHRNPQGLVTANGIVYSSEHGEGSDDELNIILKGRNYGWPMVEGYCHTQLEQERCGDSNVVEPINAWTPTLAVAGLDYYSSDAIPEWRNHLLMVSLKEQDLRVIELSDDGTRYVSEKVFFNNYFGRLRDLCIAPDGRVFIATSNRDGRGSPVAEDDRIIEIVPPYRPPTAILAPTVNGTMFPSGGGISVNFTTTGKFDTANIFTAQLSDNQGGFNAPITLGMLGGMYGGVVEGRIPCELPEGSYNVRVISSKPAVTGDTGTVPFTISAKPRVVVTSDGPTTFCEGGMVRLRASLGFTGYIWSNGSENSSVTVTQSGMYAVITRDAQGCRDTASATVTVNPKPMKPTITRQGAVLKASSSAGVAYQWYRADEPIPDAVDRTYTATEDGFYKVSVVTDAGCDAVSDSLQVRLDDPPAGVSINASTVGRLAISPLPARDRVTVEIDLDRPGILQVELVDARGVTVYSVRRTAIREHNRFEISLGDLPPGAYVLNVRSGDREWREKLVKR